MSSTKTQVPYHSLPLESENYIKLYDKETITFEDGRRLEAYRGENLSGIWIRIASPINDTSESMLKFNISDEAAEALATLLISKLRPLPPMNLTVTGEEYKP